MSSIIFFCKIGFQVAENIPRSDLDPSNYVTPEKSFRVKNCGFGKNIMVLNVRFHSPLLC